MKYHIYIYIKKTYLLITMKKERPPPRFFISQVRNYNLVDYTIKKNYLTEKGDREKGKSV